MMQRPAHDVPAHDVPTTSAPRAYSLRRRLLVRLFLATALLGLIALADTWSEAMRTAQSVSDRVLFGSALAIAEQVSLDETGILEVDIPYSSLEMLTSTAQDKVFYRITGPDGAFVSGYADLPMRAPAVGQAEFANGHYGDVAIRTVTLARVISTGERALVFRVAVAESTRARTALAREILLRAGLRLAALAVAVAVIVWAAVTAGMRPLRQLGGAIETRSPDDLRPVTLTAPTEVGPLIVAINGFMGRLDTALAALRHFTGNASHQLRTPLAVVRMQLALLERAKTAEDATGALDGAKSALARAERVLAQLLVLARVDATQSAGAVQALDIAGVARATTAEMVPLALQAGIDLGYDGPNRAIGMAEAVLLGEVLKNLIDNAIAYAGRGAVVTVRLRELPSAIALEVEDNGPGLPQLHLPARGQSLRQTAPSPAPTQGKGAHEQRGGTGGSGAGYGLGLAICAEIAALFGAQFNLHRGAGDMGLRAELILPLG